MKSCFSHIAKWSFGLFAFMLMLMNPLAANDCGCDEKIDSLCKEKGIFRQPFIYYGIYFHELIIAKQLVPTNPDLATANEEKIQSVINELVAVVSPFLSAGEETTLRNLWRAYLNRGIAFLNSDGTISEKPWEEAGDALASFYENNLNVPEKPKNLHEVFQNLTNKLAHQVIKYRINHTVEQFSQGIELYDASRNLLGLISQTIFNAIHNLIGEGTGFCQQAREFRRPFFQYAIYFHDYFIGLNLVANPNFAAANLAKLETIINQLAAQAPANSEDNLRNRWNAYLQRGTAFITSNRSKNNPEYAAWKSAGDRLARFYELNFNVPSVESGTLSHPKNDLHNLFRLETQYTANQIIHYGVASAPHNTEQFLLGINNYDLSRITIGKIAQVIFEATHK